MSEDGQDFLNWYLAAPRSKLSRCRGSSLANPMLITAFYSCSNGRSPGASWRSWVPKPGQAPSAVEPGSLRFSLSVTP